MNLSRIILMIAVILMPGLAWAEEIAERLRSTDENVQIQTLGELSQDGEKGKPYVDTMVQLMSMQWRGKRLSRWCFHALTKITNDPDKYIETYMNAAGWLHYNVVPVGESGPIGGPQPDRRGPALPDGLQEASRDAWKTSLARVAPLLKSDKLRAVQECLSQMDAPPELLVPELAAILDDQAAKPEARAAAAEIIGKYGPWKDSTDILARGIQSADASVRAASAAALGHLGTPYNPYGGGSGNPHHPRAEKAVELLLQALKDPDAAVRRSAAQGLRDMCAEGRSSAAPLSELLKNDPEKAVRSSAAYALGSIGSPDGLAALAAALTDSDNYVRSVAASSIGSLTGQLCRRDPKSIAALAKAVVPQLLAALDGDESTACAAAQSISAFRSSAAEAIPKLHSIITTSKSKSLAGRAVFALGWMGAAAKDEIPDIIKASERNSDLWGGALALYRIGVGSPVAEEFLLKLLANEDEVTRLWAVQAMGVIGSDRAEILDALKRVSEKDADEEVKRFASEAIVTIRAKAGAGGHKADF